LAVHDKRSGDEAFERFLPIILREAGDERNSVRKAVNWTLRQIGKRDKRLHGKALRVARGLSSSESKSARWIGADALRELQDPRIVGRIRK
jgi:3-methyladenine DNA glycosylase AlkD